jgi:hypothetical protein
VFRLPNRHGRLSPCERFFAAPASTRCENGGVGVLRALELGRLKTGRLGGEHIRSPPRHRGACEAVSTRSLDIVTNTLSVDGAATTRALRVHRAGHGIGAFTRNPGHHTTRHPSRRWERGEPSPRPEGGRGVPASGVLAETGVPQKKPTDIQPKLHFAFLDRKANILGQNPRPRTEGGEMRG